MDFQQYGKSMKERHIKINVGNLVWAGSSEKACKPGNFLPNMRDISELAAQNLEG